MAIFGQKKDKAPEEVTSSIQVEQETQAIESLNESEELPIDPVQSSKAVIKKSTTVKVKGLNEIELLPEHFGPLYGLVKDDSITDIDYNGRAVWTTTCDGDLKNAQIDLPASFVEMFCNRVKNGMKNKEFNKSNPRLEAETTIEGVSLRIVLVHETVATTGRSIVIRKTPPYARINEAEALEKGYITPKMMAFALNCVKANIPIAVSGEPAAGKTEFCKFLSKFIPNEKKVITVEDNLEWHYEEIKPDANCVCIRVQDNFTYSDAIKASLKMNPKWLMISEIRGEEIKAYLQALTTGVSGITTLHTDDARNIPRRMLNMTSDTQARDRMENDIYTFLNIGIQISRRARNGEKEARFVDQIVLFSNDHDAKKTKVLFSEQKLLDTTVPQGILNRLKNAGVEDVFQNDFVDQVIRTMENHGKKIKYDDRFIEVKKKNQEMKPFPEARFESKEKAVNL